MKKQYIILSIVVLVLFVTLSVCFDKFKTTNTYIEDSSSNQIKVTKGISMNLEQTAGAGDYKTVTQSNWPTEGYKFNSELSRCENSSKISWNDTNNTVVVSGNLSDKCYVYFDKILTLVEYVMSQYTGTQGNNNIFFHKAGLTYGAKDNSYRYSVSVSFADEYVDIVDNYICFGSNESQCPTDNLYRIIGVIDGKVKLIKSDYATSDLLGTDGDYAGYYKTQNHNSGNSYYRGYNYDNIAVYYWNNTTKNNNWEDSNLNKINLNKNFLENIGDKWANKIAITTWQVEGNGWGYIIDVIPAVSYENELVNLEDDITYEAKVGLMYVSDYGLAYAGAGDTSERMEVLDQKQNWMHMGLFEWTITPERYREDKTTFNIFASGGGGMGKVYDPLAVRPVFNLKDSIAYVSGSGTKSNPIRIN